MLQPFQVHKNPSPYNNITLVCFKPRGTRLLCAPRVPRTSTGNIMRRVNGPRARVYCLHARLRYGYLCVYGCVWRTTGARLGALVGKQNVSSTRSRITSGTLIAGRGREGACGTRKYAVARRETYGYWRLRAAVTCGFAGIGRTGARRAAADATTTVSSR